MHPRCPMVEKLGPLHVSTLFLRWFRHSHARMVMVEQDLDGLAKLVALDVEHRVQVGVEGFASAVSEPN